MMERRLEINTAQIKKEDASKQERTLKMVKTEDTEFYIVGTEIVVVIWLVGLKHVKFPAYPGLSNILNSKKSLSK